MGVRGFVLSLCDLTGVMVEPWLAAGHECWIVDIQHPAGWHRDSEQRGLVRAGYDVRNFDSIEAREFDIVFAFPPCTHLAVSGARWWAGKGLPPLIEALEIVEACRRICEDSGAPWMIENPVGRLSTLWREPDFTFDPYEYGDDYSKRTCIWAGGGFVMPPKIQAGDLFAAATVHDGPIDRTRIHHATPGPDRANFRSVTPAGFARAVFEANANRITQETRGER